MIDLSVDIAGIKMKNPVMPASGTFGYGEEFAQVIDISKLGAFVTKGTTLEPRNGNDQPRVAETRAGMINYIGLQNPGAKAVIKEKIPFLRQFNVPIIVNISGSSIEEYKALAEMFSQVEGVSGLELNISCPNVKQGGVAFGQDPEIAGQVLTAVSEATDLPLIMKLTPNVTNVAKIAESLLARGLDAVSLVNTFKARAKIRSGPNKGKWIEGGLSGPCIMHIALKMVSDVAKEMFGYGVPVIGMGGISCLEDALDFFESGASAIQIGTANFINPNIMIEIIEGLKSYLKENGFSSFGKWRMKVRAKP